ncbi:MAG: patatin-like phospholipase family protein [Flavobacteriaceae bacterium]
MNKIIYLLILLLLPALLFSQEEEDVKVGLVLSGGGAKGLAHIGALKVIEEAGVRIDYIGGTSMGAIIGALYASGYNAKELDSIFQAVDFEVLIQDNLPRSAKTFYEKEESEKYALTLPFDRFKVSFPSSLSKGQNVYNLLFQLTNHVSHINDFSKLPIPFFCIATDVETGQSVMLDEGHLPQAISASGALPSLFSPVEIDGRLLIDGGVTNNYPVNEVRKMGADVVIGIDVQDTLISRNNLKSVIDILVQINNYRTINDMKLKNEQTDIYIHPDIQQFSVISFERGEEIIASGKEKASLYRDELERLAARQQERIMSPVKKNIIDSLEIHSVDVKGNESYTRAYVLGKIKLKPPVVVSYEDFSEGINNLTATGNFKQINYNLTDLNDNEKELEIHLSENKTRNLLRLGVHYDDLYKSAALVNVTRKRLFQKNDIASFDLILGDNIRYNFDYYIDKGYYWSVGVKSRYNKFKKNVKLSLFPSDVIDGLTSVANIEIKHEDFTNQLYAQTVFRQIYSLGLGGEHKYLQLQTETIQDLEEATGTVFEDTNYYSAFGFLKLDSRDNKYLPKSGVYFEGSFNFYALATGLNTDFEQFSIAKAYLGYSFSPIEDVSVNITSEGGFKMGGEETSTLDFFVGGYGFKPINNFIHLFGYDAVSLRGDTFLKSTLRLNYRFYNKTHVSAIANIANVGDGLFESSAWIDSIPHRGYALGLASESFFGPLEVFYSYTTELKQSHFYVSLGFWF